MRKLVVIAVALVMASCATYRVEETKIDDKPGYQCVKEGVFSTELLQLCVKRVECIKACAHFEATEK